MPQNFFAGTIQQQDAALQVRGQQSAAHGMDNVFGEVLQAEKFFMLFFELFALAPERLCKQASQIRQNQEQNDVTEKSHAEVFRRRQTDGGSRKLSVIDQRGRTAEDRQARKRNDEGPHPGKQDAGHDDDQQIQLDEIALLQPGG